MTFSHRASTTLAIHLKLTIEMLHTNDPMVALGDLELDLILSFLSVPDAIVIRGVSTLWKARMDFRFTSSAIRRHYPAAEEAHIVYRTKDEETLAFRRVAHRYETHDKPNMARVIQNSHQEAPWCFCNNHIIRTDVDREWLYIQRVFDPKDPQRQRFPTRNLSIKRLPPLQGKSRIGLGLKVQWITGSDTSGVIVLHVGMENNLLSHDLQDVSHFRWTLAISLANGQIVWCHRAQLASDGVHGDNGLYLRIPRFQGSPTSLGHGNACIVDMGGNLTILDLTTGQQKASTHFPDNGSTTLRSQNGKYNLAAHPTMDLCFAITPYNLSVFSTRTALLVKTLKFDNYLPIQHWPWTKLHFGKRPISEGGGERAWLICDARNLTREPWMYGSVPTEAIATYEIDLEKLELVQVAIWKIAHLSAGAWTIGNSHLLPRDGEGLPSDFIDINLKFLNPMTGMGCICVRDPGRGDLHFQMLTVKFKKTGVGISVLGRPPPVIYDAEDPHYVTLPKRKLGKSGRGGEQKGHPGKNEEPITQHGRRKLIIEKAPIVIDSYFSDRYIAFTTRSEIYLFGFVARW